MPTDDDKRPARIRFDGQQATVSVEMRGRTLLGRLLCRPPHVVVIVVGDSEGLTLRVEPYRHAAPGTAGTSSWSTTERHASPRQPSLRVRIRAAQVRVSADRRGHVRTPKWIIELAKTRVNPEPPQSARPERLTHDEQVIAAQIMQRLDRRDRRATPEWIRRLAEND
jgi:hypothetical protein